MSATPASVITELGTAGSAAPGTAGSAAPGAAIVVDLSRRPEVAFGVPLRDTHVGPVTICPGERQIEARIALNAWWHLQVFPEHSAGKNPTRDHALWLLAGIRSESPIAVDPTRTPLFRVWKNRRIGFVEAYLRVYVPLYVEGLVRSPSARHAYARLRRDQQRRSVVVYDGCGARNIQQAVCQAKSAPSPAPVLAALLRGDLLEETKTALAAAGIDATQGDLPPDIAPLRESEKLPDLVGGAVVYYREAFLNCMADRFFGLFRPGGAARIPWLRRTLRMFGKEAQEGHDTAFFGDPGTSYRYTGTNHPTQPWSDDPTGALLELRDLARLITGDPYNLALLNFYRPQDSIGAHSDDERDLVPGTPIFSFSFGRKRLFCMEPRGATGAQKLVMQRLAHGSFLVMAGLTQKAYKHYVGPEPMKARETGPEDRVNVTLRCVVKRV